MKALSQEDLRIGEQAAEWLVRLEENPRSEARAAFVEWLKHSPRHLREFLLTEASYSKLNGVDPARRIDVHALLGQSSAEVIALRDSDERPSPRAFTQARSWRRRGIAAAAAIAGLGILNWLAVSMHPFDGEIYSTAVGEQRSFRLEDGSVIHLNTRSRVEVSFSERVRQIHLLEGQALFVVAHDAARPFRVAAGTAIVQAVGTQFDVYRRKNNTTVSVVEGRVQVFAPERNKLLTAVSSGGAGWTEPNLENLDTRHAPTLLAAGEEAWVTPGHIVKQASPELTNAVAWRQRQMVFRSDTLADIVEQVNRYNQVQVRIADAAVAGRRLTGVFNIDDLESLLAFLNGDGDLRFDYDIDGAQITIRARENPPLADGP